ncbi:hypothetical protein [Mesorhizobium sp. M1399]|uniref:hypothetical protein n=1 Tax=Mesorhizobium sp. M1399 TaxID=2957096 RepID=UPI003337E489
MDMSLDAYKDLGAFENTAMGSGLALSAEEKRLVEMLHDTSPMDFLQYAVRSRDRRFLRYVDRQPRGAFRAG